MGMEMCGSDPTLRFNFSYFITDAYSLKWTKRIQMNQVNPNEPHEHLRLTFSYA